jgi:hypothetical protein
VEKVWIENEDTEELIEKFREIETFSFNNLDMSKNCCTFAVGIKVSICLEK